MEQHQYEEVIKRLDTMHNALVGNPITQDGGIVGRVGKLESKTDGHDRFISRLKWSGGVLVTIAGICGYIADKIVDIFKSH